MNTTNRTTITVQTTVNQPIDQVWERWTQPEHITHWNFASDDWHCPSAVNNVQPGERFSWRMEARDGSVGFDFSGVYDQVKQHEQIVYTMDDGRQATIDFTDLGGQTRVTETFEAEGTHSIEMQRSGWQAILDNFKKYAETKA